MKRARMIFSHLQTTLPIPDAEYPQLGPELCLCYASKMAGIPRIKRKKLETALLCVLEWGLNVAFFSNMHKKQQN